MSALGLLNCSMNITSSFPESEDNFAKKLSLVMC